MEEPKDAAVDPKNEEPAADTEKPKTEKEIYFEQLRAWVQQAQLQQQMQAHFPYYLMSTYPQLFQNFVQTNSAGAVPPAPGTSPAPSGSVPNTTSAGSTVASTAVSPQDQNNQPQRRAVEIGDPARQEEIINQNGGYEYVIAPLWKRFIAEAIDIVILFLFKIMTAMIFMDFSDINLLDIDLDAIRNSLEEDYTELLSFTSELILLEIMTKFAVCIYETSWTFQGQGQMGGATPGKMLMGIRIVHVEAVVLMDPPPPPGLLLNNQAPTRALLFPATNPGLKRAFCRSVAKNALIALFFPMCLLIFFFKHNRTMYDIMTKTIVVEDNPTPTLRRR